eukprot:CAMPEP_0184389262 /NCGR_PEP_ID=MMETSP0007-20130409/12332_1 /TAXON_ID=97485 /ORGANISM="Prymnesium parvum, Strain Texoma1" /LENGTH=65 /DNA_ID=CAMNT_0026738507 /DNA_START=207 /DNA_END=404 /DNA_ORIENTATION=+
MSTCTDVCTTRGAAWRACRIERERKTTAAPWEKLILPAARQCGTLLSWTMERHADAWTNVDYRGI